MKTVTFVFQIPEIFFENSQCLAGMVKSIRVDNDVALDLLDSCAAEALRQYLLDKDLQTFLNEI